ncbi:MAG TPA: hypothetical protein VKV25_09765 [Acidimicrobiales bacterium]|nr:hypothetical protein [Acidimicrobiales bacterium]
MSIRSLVADESATASLGAWTRRRRSQQLVAAFPELSAMSVLDLGGTEHFWESAVARPSSVVLLNPDEQPTTLPWIRSVAGDACDPPADIRATQFDLVFSNSTIEHVGGHLRRRQFADTVRTAAPRAWVQTPNRYFPLEPHWVLPAGQFIPPRPRAAIVRRWPLRPRGFPRDVRTALNEIMDIELLSRAQLAWYFPEATIRSERVLGLAKSLIAVIGAADGIRRTAPARPVGTGPS